MTTPNPTTTFSADLYDGSALTYEVKETANAANETEAIQKAKNWARSFDQVPRAAWLRVHINDSVRSFRLSDL